MNYLTGKFKYIQKKQNSEFKLKINILPINFLKYAADIYYSIQNSQFSYRSGFMAISAVLLISAVAMVIAATVSLSGISEAQSSFAIHTGEINLALIEGCAEDGMLKARSNATFGNPVGSPVTISRPEGTCILTVISRTGTNPVVWTMNVTTTDVKHQRKIRVIFNRYTTGIILVSWKEI